MGKKWFSLCLLICMGLVLAQKPQKPFRYPNKIVGGQTTPISSVPYQVAVLVARSICGGSLIQRNMVLTAAHCVADSNPSSVQVRAGSNFYNRNGILQRASKVIYNRNFNFNTMTHDVAIIKLARPFTDNEMQNYSIKLISLATSVPPDGSSAIASGYGTLSESGLLAPTLQSVTVNKINFSRCNQLYSNRLTSTMICAGNNFGGKDSCQGDSGGPLVYQSKLIGIVSWGRGCAHSNFPGVYTSVPTMLSWITEAKKIL